LDSNVTILILNCNLANFTRDCLESLQKIDYPNFRILVVDNGSSDDSLRQVAHAFPTAEFIWLKENLGVAGGRNVGVREALRKHPDYILFLDNDTVVAPDFLSRLVARMNGDPRIGAVQPKIYFSDPPNRICSVGGRLSWRISHYRHPGSGQMDSDQFQESTDVDIVSGCAGLVRSKVFYRIGLLDETYSPYCHEDVDWSVRLKDAGYRIVVEPAAKIWHRVSTQPKTSAEKLGYLAKGHVLFLRFHTRPLDLPLSILWICIHMSRCYLSPALARKDWNSVAAVFAGIWAGLRDNRRTIEWPLANDRYQESNPPSNVRSLICGKKILLIGVLGPFDSGPTRVYETLLKSHFVERFQVRFVDLQFASSVADFERVRPQKFLRLFWYLLQMICWLATEKYDALCIHLSTNRNAFLKDSLFAWLGFLFHVPVIVLEHGTNIPVLYQRSGRFVKWFMKATLSRLARCIVLAECLKFNFEGFLPSERIVSSYLGIDSSDNLGAFIQNTGAGDPVTLLYLSALIESKGILVLLQALPNILSRAKNVRVVIAGGWGWDSAKIKAEVDRFLTRPSYADKVSFIGAVQGDKKFRVFQSADMFILPTLADTAPIVLLEAMRAGLPVIATNVGAIPEILSDGVNGLICEKANSQDLGEKVLYLIERPNLRQQMAQKSVQRFQNLFTAEKFAGRMIDVFESVLAERNRGIHVEAVET
jgi:GT2 family glycosyltransferase/glycosyltransferase involved in cell wall biosynthesis